MSALHSSEKAASLNATLRLEDVALFSVEAKNIVRTPKPKLGFSMDLGEAVWGRVDQDVIVFLPLSVSIDDTRGDERTKLATFAVTLQLTYGAKGLREDAPVSDYVAFGSWMQAWPYFRAEVQALSAKLGFPPLVLPVLLPGQTGNAVVREQRDEPKRESRAAAKAKRAAR